MISLPVDMSAVGSSVASACVGAKVASAASRVARSHLMPPSCPIPALRELRRGVSSASGAHCALRLARRLLLLERLALVVKLLAARQSNLDLGAAVKEVQAQRH